MGVYSSRWRLLLRRQRLRCGAAVARTVYHLGNKTKTSCGIVMINLLFIDSFNAFETFDIRVRKFMI